MDRKREVVLNENILFCKLFWKLYFFLLNFLFDVSVNLVRKKIRYIGGWEVQAVGRKRSHLDLPHIYWWICPIYRLWAEKKDLILIRICLNFFLVLLLLLFLLIFLIAKEKQKRLSTSVSKWGLSYCTVQVCWNANSLIKALYLIKAWCLDSRWYNGQNIVSSQETVLGWEKQATLCPFCKQKTIGRLFISPLTVLLLI